MEDRRKRTGVRPEEALPDGVEEANQIGADAADATSGVPETPEEWAEEQPLEDEPTHPMDAGDPSPFQPAAGTPSGGPVDEEDESDQGR